jgi:dolichyl-diphosphooligosaccharide--protein glycosyltransferase
MNPNSILISIGNFDFKLNHLLIIGILSISFTVSFLLRAQPADFGYELNEFDPFFNYRATQYIVDNGIDAYFDWNDDLSWYPEGRNISQTSQVMLHLTTAVTYWIFGGGEDLYNYTILFPVIIGSFTVIALFALVRVIGGTTTGLFSALFFSVSIPILMRGPIGWFKSEPLGIFYGILAVYLFLSGIKSENKKIAALKIIVSGITLGLGLASWGGIQFFIIPIGIFILILPFLRKDFGFIVWAIPLFVISFFLTISMFERPGAAFIYGMGGFALILPTGFLVACIIIQKFSKLENQTRNGLLFLIAILIIGSFLIIINEESNLLNSPKFRYLNAINPFLTTTDPLVDSVSEHATTTIQQSFLFHSVLMIFSGIGIWLIIKNIQNKNSSFINNDMLSFSLILGLIGVYMSSTFVRLEVFGSISVIILASLGLTALTKEFFNQKNQSKKSTQKFLKFPYVVGIIFLLLIPMIYPVGSTASAITNNPPTILNGGSSFPIATNDWLDALDWLKNNTPKDAVVASWWDYGYWIQTMGERASLADNSTLHTNIIENIAKMLLSDSNTAWNTLNEMEADYVMIFVAGEKLNLNTDNSFYTLRNGGDESKKQHSDGISGTDYFWNETLLGKMIPFSIAGYVNPNNLNQQSVNYVPGMLAIYEKDIKFLSDGNGPLKLVYASPSFTEEKSGPMIGVFIYEVNEDYQPMS